MYFNLIIRRFGLTDGIRYDEAFGSAPLRSILSIPAKGLYCQVWSKKLFQKSCRNICSRLKFNVRRMDDGCYAITYTPM